MTTELSRRDFLKGAAALAALPPIQFNPADPTRTAIVSEFIAKLDTAISDLMEARRFLADALAMPPGEVDGLKWLEYERIIGLTGDRLEEAISPELSEQSYPALTGRSVDYWVTRSFIVEGLADPDLCQREIRALRKTNPAEAAELQAMLDKEGV